MLTARVKFLTPLQRFMKETVNAVRSWHSGRTCVVCGGMIHSNNNSVLERRKFISHIWRQKWTEGDKKGGKDISSVVVPVPLTPANNSDDINIGEELSGKIQKADISKLINKFSMEAQINILAAEQGLDSKLFQRAVVNFRQFCIDSKVLPPELHIIFSDILRGAGHLHNIYPYFMHYCHQIFPHLGCMKELKAISDLRNPANWYPEARSRPRKLIFHAGPTNSGKTYHALECFVNAKSGVYCGPLKLLVSEVFSKTNEKGRACDMITGEERRTVLPENMPASHLACTVEMVSVEKPYDVAVIDEIQMMRDLNRGWAWTRALLGINADEVHICGEEAAIDLVREIAISCGEDLEVRRYKRLTSLTVEDNALVSLNNVQPGDCIVCFNKADIYNVSIELERKGYEYAVIYGSLPPGTKLAQAKNFNDPNHPCKILVATDAIGMGLNLSIRRVIFYSLTKPSINEKGEKEIDTISTSQALQIAGRAGRFNTQFSEGFVTTFRSSDIPILQTILSKPLEPLEKAGLHPTADQVELFAYHLPQATLSNLIDIFVSLCVMDTSLYFMCDTENFQFLADKINDVPLPLRARYVFCCAPINRKLNIVCHMFEKFSKQYSQNEPLTVDGLCRAIGWPFGAPKNIYELATQEAVFDVLDLYLWLSYRFPDLFPDVQPVRNIQQKLDVIIQNGVCNITHLIKAGETSDHYDHEENNDNRGKFSNYHSDVKSVQKMKALDIGKGQVTEQLLSEGLLTPEIVMKLHEEWRLNEENSEQFSRTKAKYPKSRQKRTKK